MYIKVSCEYIFVKRTLCFISQVCKVDQATLQQVVRKRMTGLQVAGKDFITSDLMKFCFV